MQRYQKYLILFGILAITIHAFPVSAHELLPGEILELLEQNPGLTEAELDAYLDQVEADSLSVSQVIKRFLWLGFTHILQGFDHVLFVLALLLACTRLRQILHLITAFTIAHSVTFLLGGWQLFTLSPKVVEPLIAFSIAYVAYTSVFLVKSPLHAHRNTILSVFGFGLFHGLGFAGLLENFVIPSGQFLTALLAFNIGIEAGQLTIICLALPLIIWAQRWSWYAIARQVLALVIIGLSLGWVVERVW